MHEVGITHSDLKPANLLLMVVVSSVGSIQLRITDLGMAKVVGVDSKTMSTLGHTPAYAAPEQTERATGTPKHLSSKVDIFSTMWHI
jgi:serine/threonine-protein kinase